MKKYLKGIRLSLFVLFLCLFSVKTVNAQTINTSGDWEYSVVDGYAIVQGYIGNQSNVIIPTKLGGYYVEEISANAFEGNTFSSITIPERIRVIGRHAFYNCRKLSNINYNAINSSCNLTGETFYRAGADTNGLTLTFGTGVEKIPDYLFANCDTSKLTTVNMSDSIREIGNKAFTGCKELNKVTWSKGLENIGYAAFNGCTKLQSATLSNGVTEIGREAFMGCTKLQAVTIPSSVSTIGYQAFYNCRGLSSLVFNAASSSCNLNGETFYRAGADTNGLTLTFGTGVKKIPDYLFDNCDISKLTTVNMSDSIQEIGRYAFEDCKELNKVTWSKKLENIGYAAFSGCTKLQSATLPNGMAEIGYHAFYNCRGLSNLVFNAASSSCNLNGETFYRAGVDTNGLTVTFGAEVKKIPDYLFANCDISKLTTVNMSDSIQEIGREAFAGCKELNGVTWSKGLENIGDKAFNGCTKLQSAPLPNGVTEIGRYAFADCTKLQAVTIPSSVSSIGYQAFYNCRGLSNLEFNAVSSSCNSSGGTFYRAGTDTAGLTLTFGTGVKKIPNYLFDRSEACKLTTINISSTVQEIGYSAFANCYSLKKVNVKAKNIKFAKNAYNDCPSSLVFECYKNSTADDFARSNGFQVRYIRNGLYNDNGTWHYYVDGKADTTYTGLCEYGGEWYFVQSGAVNFRAAGLWNQFGNWWYVENGKVNFKATGLCQYGKDWYFVENGAVNFRATGLWHQFGNWWFIQNGAVNFKATGLWNQFGNWWFIQNGVVNFKATGLCQHGGNWWYVENGAVNFKATGLCPYGGNWWYVQSGAVNFKYNGQVPYGNAYYNVVNGRVVF